jgi:hypothetical protein
LDVTIYGNGNIQVRDFEELFDMNSFEMYQQPVDWTPSTSNPALQSEAQKLISTWQADYAVTSDRAYPVKSGKDIHTLVFDMVKELTTPENIHQMLAYIDFRQFPVAKVVLGKANR